MLYDIRYSSINGAIAVNLHKYKAKSLMSQSQSHLLKRKIFLPFFLTQFFGAMNDNLFKTVILITLALVAAEQAGLWSNAAHLAFVLPFFMFSAWSGHYADQVEKSQWIQKIKLLEILIMSFGVVCLWLDSLTGLIIMLFLMGTQSTLFGPVKFALIPQHIDKKEITSANAWVELGTFLAILIGNLLAGILFELSNPQLLISICLIVLAGVGYISSRYIPQAPPYDHDQNTHNDTSQQPSKRLSTLGLLRLAKGHKSLFLSMLGVSWFWFLGSAYLTQLPVFTSQYLSSTESVISLFLVAFSIGVGIGSLLASKLSAGTIEIGLVPLGALGLSIFGGLLAAVPSLADAGETYSFIQALSSATHLKVFTILIGLGASGGLYIVPLYGLIQTRSPAHQCAQMIAANNILNALLMVAAALVGILTLGVLHIPLNQFFWLLVLLNCLVAIYIFTLVPEFLARFMVFCLVRCMYRVQSQGLREHIPDEGPVILVSNHVSFVDALLIGGMVSRPTRFIMYQPIYKMPILHFIFKSLGTIPIESKSKNPAVYAAAFDAIEEKLNDNEVIVIFPEGKLTKDGTIDEFKPGLLKVLEKNPVPVVPIAIQGLWGSFFSHKNGPAMAKKPRRIFAKVGLVADKPWQPQTDAQDQPLIDLPALRQKIIELSEIKIESQINAYKSSDK